MTDKNEIQLTEEQQELMMYIWDRRYTLDAMDVSAKLVFDWSKQGLLLDPIKPKSRRKYSIVEFVWFKLIIGLRNFGMSLDAIRNVRSLLLQSLTFEDIIDLLMNEEEQEELIEHMGEKKLTLFKQHIQNMKDELSEDEFYAELHKLNLPEFQYMNTILSHVILESVLLRREIVFNITSNGDNYLEIENDPQSFYHPELDEQPYIRFPLRLLIGKFIQHESMSKPEELLHFKFLTKKEMEILEMLKNDNLVSLTIRMGKDQEIKLIESEESIRVENASGKLTDYLMRNNYQEIVCKTQNGKVTSMRRKTKHK